MSEFVRLQLYLARCGLGSRRKCEELIASGLVEVNGVIVDQQGVKIGKGDEVRFQGQLCLPEERKIYLLVNKPPRYLCSNSDPQGRPLVSDLFGAEFPERLFHVGRLDFMSQGLVLYTNDGQWSNAIAHPSREIEKEYLVQVKSLVDKALLNEALRGISIEGVVYCIKNFVVLQDNLVKITLIEGKNREIRRIFKHWNWPINFLKRIRIGRITDKGLEPGSFRQLTEAEILEMKKN